MVPRIASHHVISQTKGENDKNRLRTRHVASLTPIGTNNLISLEVNSAPLKPYSAISRHKLNYFTLTSMHRLPIYIVCYALLHCHIRFLIRLGTVVGGGTRMFHWQYEMEEVSRLYDTLQAFGTKILFLIDITHISLLLMF